jgi:hypothetical protein
MDDSVDLCIGDRLVSKLDHMLEPEVTAVRRLEVISGTGRRRQFASDFKARIVEETLVPASSDRKDWRVSSRSAVSHARARARDVLVAGLA